MGTRLNCFLYVVKTKRAFSNSVYFIRKGNLKCLQRKHVQEVNSVFINVQLNAFQYNSLKLTLFQFIRLHFCLRSQIGINSTLWSFIRSFCDVVLHSIMHIQSTANAMDYTHYEYSKRCDVVGTGQLHPVVLLLCLTFHSLEEDN